jgi:hypothetical protein
MYKFMPYNSIEKYIPEMIKEEVSKVARSKGQFLDQYKKHGVNLPSAWQNKRNAFIARTLAAYKLKPSYRRKLALIAWAYLP